MVLWSLGILIAILVALPIIVRLRTGAWGNGKSFRETYAANRNSPAAKERQRRRNYKARTLLVFGLPFGLLLVSFCEWMHYPRSIYWPIATGLMLLLSNLLANYLHDRATRAGASKP
jgi:peptidoglycan/LPS O-acetylase OafA/YrhL